jgi:hypothetical protein
MVAHEKVVRQIVVSLVEALHPSLQGAYLRKSCHGLFHRALHVTSEDLQVPGMPTGNPLEDLLHLVGNLNIL